MPVNYENIESIFPVVIDVLQNTVPSLSFSKLITHTQFAIFLLGLIFRPPRYSKPEAIVAEYC